MMYKPRPRHQFADDLSDLIVLFVSLGAIVGVVLALGYGLWFAWDMLVLMAGSVRH